MNEHCEYSRKRNNVDKPGNEKSEQRSSDYNDSETNKRKIVLIYFFKQLGILLLFHP